MRGSVDYPNFASWCCFKWYWHIVRSLTLTLPPRKPAYKQQSRPSQCFAYAEIMCTMFRWVPRAMNTLFMKVQIKISDLSLFPLWAQGGEIFAERIIWTGKLSEAWAVLMHRGWSESGKLLVNAVVEKPGRRRFAFRKDS